MTDAPTSTTTTTTTTTTSSTENTSIIYVWKFPVDKSFVLSVNSILQISAAFLSLIACICVASGRTTRCDESYSASYDFFEFVSISTFLTLLFSWTFYTLTLSQRVFLKRVPWILVDLVYCAVYTVFYLIANSLVAARACSTDSNKAASAFGFLAMFCIVGNAFLQLRLLRIQRAHPQRVQSADRSAERDAEQGAEKY